MITGHDLAQARAAQASIMTAYGVIHTEPVGWVWDADQARSVPAPGPVVYEGPMRVQPARGQAGMVPAAAQDMAVPQYACAIPWDARDVRPGYVLEVTASTDPALTGLRLTVTSVERSTLATARRFHAVEHQSEVAP